MKVAIKVFFCGVLFLGIIIGCRNSASGSSDTAIPEETPDTPITLSEGSVANLLTWTGTTASVQFRVNKEGSYYYIVQSATLAEPTVAQIKSQPSYIKTKGTGISVAGLNTINTTGMSPKVNYTFYMVLETDDLTSDVFKVLNIKPISKFASWTVLTSSSLPFGANPIFTNIAYGEGKFIVASRSGKIATSPDGVTWTLINSPLLTYTTNLEYGNGRLVVVAYDYSSTPQVKIKYSTDFGTTWNTGDISGLPNLGQTVKFIKYVDGKFFLAIDNTIAYSADASVWTVKTITGSNPIRDIAFGNGKLIAVSSGSANGMVYSIDNGVTWTLQNEFYTAIGGVSPLNCIAYGNSIFVAAGDGYEDGYSADYGATWKYLTPSEGVFGSPQEAQSIIFAGGSIGLFLATSDFSCMGYSTPDAKNWKTVELSGLSSTLAVVHDIEASDNRVVIVTNGGEIAYTD